MTDTPTDAELIAAVKAAIEIYEVEATGYENGAQLTGDGSRLLEEAAAYRRSADALRAVLARLEGLADRFAAQHSTAPVSGDARERAREVLDKWCGSHVGHYIPDDRNPEAYRELHEHIAAALTAAEDRARREERERIQEQGWCYQHQCYHRNFRCEHDHGAVVQS